MKVAELESKRGLPSPQPERGRSLRHPASSSLLTTNSCMNPPFRLLPGPCPSQPPPFPSPASLASSWSPYFLLHFSTTLPHLWPNEGIEPTQTHTSEGSPPNLNLLASPSCSVVTLPLVAFEAPQFSPNLTSGLVPVVGPPGDCIPKSPFSHFQDLPPGGVPPPGCSPWMAPRWQGKLRSLQGASSGGCVGTSGQYRERECFKTSTAI